MFKIQPQTIEVISGNQYTVEFLRAKDNTSVVYTFTFSDNPRGISDYDKEFYFDTMDDMNQLCSVSWALLSFDTARELGVATDQYAEKLIPVSLSVRNDTPGSSSYNIVFATETGHKDYTISVTGDSRNREAVWEFGSCKTWFENGQFRFEDTSPASEPLLKAVLRVHEARHSESEVAEV